MKTLSLLTLLALAAFCLSGPAGACHPCSFLRGTTLLKIPGSALGVTEKGQATGEKGWERTELTVHSFLTDAKPGGSESDKGTGSLSFAPPPGPKPPDSPAFCLGIPTFPPKPRKT